MEKHKENQKKDVRTDSKKTDQPRGKENAQRDQQGQSRPQQEKQR